jgi:tetratricopeptide (TPR) repeat protein
MRRFADEAAADVGAGGKLWFVFIGHGAPAKDGSGGILVGYDAQQDADSLFARSLPAAELLDRLNRGRQAQTVVILDACFSGRAGSGDSLVPGLQPLIVARTRGATDPRTILMTAGKSDEFAGPLPGERRPAFSYLALGALRGWGDGNHDGQITANEALAYSRDALRALVMDRTQSPELVAVQPDFVLALGGEHGPNLSAIALAGAAPVKSAREATAREHLLKGQMYAQSGRPSEAEAELRQAEQLAPDWESVHVALAEVAEQSKHYDDAIRSQRWLLARSTPDRRPAIEQKIAALAIAADDAKREGAEQARRDAQATLERKREQARAAEELDRTRRRDLASSRHWALALGGVGVASLGAAGVFAYLGKSQNDAIEKGGFGSWIDVQDAANKGSLYNTLGYVFLTTGIVLVAISVPWYLWSREPGTTVGVVPTSGGALVGASGRF